MSTMKLLWLAIGMAQSIFVFAVKFSEVPAATCLADDWVSNLMCSNTPRPKVAVCIAGAARTFAKAPVHRSIQTNLIEAFGGDVTIFAAIKTDDVRGDLAPQFNGTIQSDDAVVRAALIRIGAKPENTILGAGSYPDEKPSPKCAIKVLGNGSGSSLSLNGQVNAKVACNNLMTKAEQRMSTTFDFVILTRPDMSWSLAVRPYCMWDLKKMYNKKDWHYMFPRQEARRMLEELPNKYFGCTELKDMFYPETYQTNFVQPSSDWGGSAGLSGIVTRQNKDNMPHNLCGEFPGDATKCAAMTDTNRCVQ